MESLLAQIASMDRFQIILLAIYLLLQGAVVPVFPEEVIITTLGFLWGQGRISFVEALLATWVGVLLANATTVFMFGKFGSKLLRFRFFSNLINKERVQNALSLIRQKSSWIIFVTRFTPLIRGPVYWASGLSGIPVFRFMKVDFLASCIQVPALLWMGRVVGTNSGSMMEGYRNLGIVLLAFFGIVYLIKWLVARKGEVAISESVGD